MFVAYELEWGVLMERRAINSNVTSGEMAAILAALAANVPPPPEVKPEPPGGTLCKYAEDSGELAFPNFPCRGHRIACRKTGVVTFAANCRPDKCNCFSEKGDRR